MSCCKLFWRCEIHVSTAISRVECGDAEERKNRTKKKIIARDSKVKNETERKRGRANAKDKSRRTKWLSYFVEWKFQIYRLIAFAVSHFMGMESQALRLIQIRSKGLRVSQMNRFTRVASCNHTIGDAGADFILLSSLSPSLFRCLTATSSLVMEFILEHFYFLYHFFRLSFDQMETTKLVISFDCFG